MHQRGTLTRDSQLIYLSQWLGEYSEIEKDDFLQHLLDVFAPGQLALGPRLAPLKEEAKLPTLFDCRMDLFKEWVSSWEENERDELLTRLKETDPDFFDRFEKSKSIANEEKIVDEFWLKNGHHIVTNGTMDSAEQNGEADLNGTVEQNGTMKQNGALEQNGTVEQNGAVEQNGTVEQNGDAILNGEAVQNDTIESNDQGEIEPEVHEIQEQLDQAVIGNGRSEQLPTPSDSAE